MSDEGKLLSMLKSPKASVRYDATELLRVQSSLSPAALEALEQAHQDPDSSVRESAASALRVHKPEPDQSLNGQRNVVEAEGRKRGGCLTAWLLYGLIGYPLVLLSILLTRPFLKQYAPNQAVPTNPLFVIASIALFVSSIAIWKWKRWGVYAYFGISIIYFVGHEIYLLRINLIHNLSEGLPFQLFGAILGIIGLVIFALLIRPIWHQMD